MDHSAYLIAIGHNGEYVFTGQQAFFGFADRNSYSDRSKDGGFYKVNGCINFWSNEVNHNFVTIDVSTGDMAVDNNGYGSYGRGSIPAHFFVNSHDPSKPVEIIRAIGGQTADLEQWQGSNGVPFSRIDKFGGFHPSHMNDFAAQNDSIYFCSSRNKLVYKDSSGNVNELY